MPIWEQYERALSADIQDNLLQTVLSPSPALVRNNLLQELQDTLHGFGHTLSDIGLPEPFDRQIEIEHELGRWGGDPGNLSSFEASLWPEQVRNTCILHAYVYSDLSCSALSTTACVRS